MAVHNRKPDRLFSYLKQQVKNGFVGTIELPFQDGKLGYVKEHNMLAPDFSGEVVILEKVFGIISNWIDSKFYGIIKIPFMDGKLGKPMECRVLKPEEL